MTEETAKKESLLERYERLERDVLDGQDRNLTNDERDTIAVMLLREVSGENRDFTEQEMIEILQKVTAEDAQIKGLASGMRKVPTKH